MVKSYDVFISSPSDVSAERDIVQEALEQINQIRGVKEGFRLNPIRWEKDVSSQIGARPQEVINQQIGDDFDIFVGILCARFGQKTGSYESGTEEEFYRAYTRLEEAEENIEILFYFKDPRKSEGQIDPEQLVKVVGFKKKIQYIGIYEEFDSPDEFNTKLVAALSKALDRIEKKTNQVLQLSQ